MARWGYATGLLALAGDEAGKRLDKSEWCDFFPMSAINTFLLQNDLRIFNNPCISPDFCLDWASLADDLRTDCGITVYPKSHFETSDGRWSLVENAQGDHAWVLEGGSSPLNGEVVELSDGRLAYPATWANLLILKNRIQEFDPASTIFPGTQGTLGKSTLGVGARFTTLHWPGVDWAMSNLGIGVTANQNSIPRELVFDVETMLANKLDKVPFPFIGADVPEGHQGQSVEGMSHGCVIAKLKSGFHNRRIPWSFNADHQPIGGQFDAREDQLVTGCLLASYITFDLSPELALTKVPGTSAEQADYVAREMDASLVETVKARVAQVGIPLETEAFNHLLCQVWPSMKKMKIRDGKYRAVREAHFTTEVGCTYLRELSIDELPGLTTPETTAIMLALCEAMDMPVQFVAPAFGFQKNMPYPDNAALRALILKQWTVCEPFGVSIGFHSGSGKSAENYTVMGEVTGCNLEIKTSGRYTYEMGRALAVSTDAGDQRLWKDWYQFTRDLAVLGAFSEQDTERKMAREFIEASFVTANLPAPEDLFSSAANCSAALARLSPSPEAMFWFEYNFLYVLAAEGKPEKASLGDHSPAGYRQRARFYAISDSGRLEYARNVAQYLIFLAETTGLVDSVKCAEVAKRLNGYRNWNAFFADIGEDTPAFSKGNRPG